ncbi:MAG: hypothetical protein QG578_690, partial [Thermodesulfobacteriota bacterium]|nr:hypothetical protein [Thermodesulfobacteriota bacterium]
MKIRIKSNRVHVSEVVYMINIKNILFGFMITGFIFLIGCGGMAELTKAELK